LTELFSYRPVDPGVGSGEAGPSAYNLATRKVERKPGRSHTVHVDPSEPTLGLKEDFTDPSETC